MKSLLAIASFTNLLGLALAACNITTNGVKQATLMTPTSNSQFNNIYLTNSVPYTSYYIKNLDVLNGFKAEYSLAVGGTVTSTLPSDYPTFSLVISSGISTGNSLAVIISPTGTISFNGVTKSFTSGVLTNNIGHTISLQYNPTSIGSELSLTLDTQIPLSFPLSLATFQTTLGGSSLGYIGLISSIDKFVPSSNAATYSLAFNSLTLTTLQPSLALSSLINPPPSSSQTLTVGSSITFSITIHDSCNQLMTSSSIINGFCAYAAKSDGTSRSDGTITFDTSINGRINTSINVLKTGTLDLHAGYCDSNGNILSSILSSTSAVIANNGPIVGASTTISSAQPLNSLLFVDSNTTYQVNILAFDSYKNQVIIKPSGSSSFFSSSLDSPDGVTTLPVEVVWSSTVSTYVASFSVPASGVYKLHIMYTNPSTSPLLIDIPSSPFVITVINKGADIININNTNITAIIAGTLGGLFLLGAIYGIWRLNRYRSKHVDKKKLDDKKTHEAKVKKHEMEMNNALHANPTVLNDDGGFVSVEQVDEAKVQYERVERIAKIETDRNELLSMAIEKATLQVGLLKQKKQKDEVKNTVVPPTKVAKKKKEFTQESGFNNGLSDLPPPPPSNSKHFGNVRQPVVSRMAVRSMSVLPSVSTELESSNPVTDLVFNSRTEEIVYYTSQIDLSYYPSDLAFSYINSIAIVTELPWWATLMVSAGIIRITLFPLIIKQMRNGAKMANMGPEQKRLQEEIAILKKTNDHVAVNEKILEVQKLFKKHGVSPLSMLVAPLVQMPIFISMFFAVQKMCPLYPSFKDGGLLWFTDLTATDPTYALPVISSGLMFIAMELTQKEMGTQQPEGMKMLMRGMCLISIPITSHFPAGVFMYWIAMNCVSLTQSISFYSFPSLKEALGIPKVTAIQSPMENPFTKMFAKESSNDTNKIQYAAFNELPPPTTKVLTTSLNDSSNNKGKGTLKAEIYGRTKNIRKP